MPFHARILALVGAALVITGSAEADSLNLRLGELRRESAPGTVANVVVADPAVADVTVTDQHSVIIIGKGFGVTDVLATDRAGHVLIDDRVMVGAASEGGRVTLYRGTVGSDYACMPRCGAGRTLGASGGGAVESAASAPEAADSAQPPMTVSPPVTVATTGP